MYSKPTKIRSKKIRDSARGEYCTLRIPDVCNHNPETVVFAHLPGNKGTGTKNHDLMGIYACYKCHLELDAGNIDAKDQLRAFQETLLRLVDKGIISYI